MVTSMQRVFLIFAVVKSIISFHANASVGVKTPKIFVTPKLSKNFAMRVLSCKRENMKGVFNLQELVAYARQFVGLPYVWGGDDPIFGWDCSGLVQEFLASVGQDPPGDQTAQGLFDFFSKNGRVFAPHQLLSDLDALGALAFFGKDPTKIGHVGFVVANSPLRMIEAGGGNSTTKTLKDAARQNAFVRERPVHRRKDLVAIIRPHYLMMRGRF